MESLHQGKKTVPKNQGQLPRSHYSAVRYKKKEICILKLCPTRLSQESQGVLSHQVQACLGEQRSPGSRWVWQTLLPSPAATLPPQLGVKPGEGAEEGPAIWAADSREVPPAPFDLLHFAGIIA